MIIGIWRAPRDNARPLDDYKKFQHDVVIPEMKMVKGASASSTSTPTPNGAPFKSGRAMRLTKPKTSPQAKRISEKLAAAGLLPAGEGTYETVDVHNGFAHNEVLEKFMK